MDLFRLTHIGTREKKIEDKKRKKEEDNEKKAKKDKEKRSRRRSEVDWVLQKKLQEVAPGAH